MLRLIISFITIVSSLLSHIAGYKILGILPYPSYSHQIVFRALSAELLNRSHELLVFTTYPMNNKRLTNYTEVDLSFIRDDFKNKTNFFNVGKQSVWTFYSNTYVSCAATSDAVLAHPVMQRLMAPNNTEKFDLIIIQHLFYDALYALSIRFNVPMIGITPFNALAIQHYHFGNPLLTSYSPNVLSGYTDKMNLWDRIVNMYYNLRLLHSYLYVNLPHQEKVLRKHFGDSMPPIQELHKNFSLLLVNSHPFLVSPRANVPAMIYMGGCRFKKHPKKTLPEGLKKILDKSTSGFIYFSLGSNAKSTELPIEIRNTLLSTFASLPYTVLWKFETDYIVNKPDNVIIRKWLPQHEILAHPNIVLFIYQGGLQSSEECIENGVPMIGIPMFTDQTSNVRKLESLGVLKVLSFHELQKETLKRTISEVITNPSYKENVRKLRDLLQDLPYHPMEHAVWWIEHVIRHKGASHLRNRSRDMPWYQLELVDVMAILGACLVLVLYIIFLILRYVRKKVVQYVKLFTIKSSKKEK